MKDHDKYYDVEKKIRSLPKPDYENKFTKDIQDNIHENLLQFASSYEKKKRRATTMRKLFVGIASIAALLLFAFLIKPIYEDYLSSSNGNKQAQQTQERPSIDENKVGQDKETNNQNANDENQNNPDDNQNKTDNQKPDTIVYENKDYGFTFTLPNSWDGYKIVPETWEGISINQEQSNVIENGPILLIRHPEWTEEKPRQDIPIMIFTHDQWTLLQNGEFHIGAAPIGPTMLGENNNYVFALPARYNFAFLEGYQEVEDILNNHPLQTTN